MKFDRLNNNVSAVPLLVSVPFPNDKRMLRPRSPRTGLLLELKYPDFEEVPLPRGLFTKGTVTSEAPPGARYKPVVVG